MTEYKRLTNRKEITKYCLSKICDDDCENCYWGKVSQRLSDLETQIENGTLVDIETVAKLMVKIMDDCPCNFDNIAEYMCEHYYDWCEKLCVSACETGDFTHCWVKYLTAKLAELKGNYD